MARPRTAEEQDYHSALAQVIANPIYGGNYTETHDALHERTADTIVETEKPKDILWDDIISALTDGEVNTLLSLKVVDGVLSPATASGDPAQTEPARRIMSWLASHGLLNGLTVAQAAEAMIRRDDRPALADLITLMSVQGHISPGSAQALNGIMAQTEMVPTVIPGDPMWKVEGLFRGPTVRDVQIARNYV